MSDRNLTTRRTQVFGDVRKGTDCRVCGRNVTDGRSKHCSQYCRNIVEAVMQLLNWSSVRRRILNRDGHTCQECGFNQDWLDRGYQHLRRICKSELPERPESPPIEEYSTLTDEERERHRERHQEWLELRNEVIEEYYNEDEWSIYTSWPVPESRLEVDHITPIVEGGHPFDPTNLITLCEDCHTEKTARENSERAARQQPERPEQDLTEFILSGGKV